MLLETKRLEIMREKTKKLVAALKTSVPEQAFLRPIHTRAQQVKNLKIRVVVGKHIVNLDEPLDGGGDDTAQSPLDTLLVALAACIEVNWITYSSAFNLDIREVVVEVEGMIDRRFVLSGANSVPARLNAVKIIYRVVTSAPRENVERIHQKVQQFCPVSESLHPDITKVYLLDTH